MIVLDKLMGAGEMIPGFLALPVLRCIIIYHRIESRFSKVMHHNQSEAIYKYKLTGTGLQYIGY